jgi:hypothetical protein
MGRKGINREEKGTQSIKNSFFTKTIPFDRNYKFETSKKAKYCFK